MKHLTPDTNAHEQPSRRRVLELIASSAVALPLLGLQGCSSGEEASSSAASERADTSRPTQPESPAQSAVEAARESADAAMESADAAMESAEEAMESATEAMTDAAPPSMGDMPRVDPNGAQAQGLGYVENAGSSNNARYAAGQQCTNCALYQGGDSAWGGCPLFAGQQVKGTGWCSAYAARS